MSTVGDDLDLVALKLNDAEALWTREELLRWYQDGYRTLLADTHAVRRLRALDLPGRHTYAITHEWEDRYTDRGTIRKASRTTRAGTAQASGLWETEVLGGVTPGVALDSITQEWERAYVETDRHYRFTMPHNHERIARLEWHNRRLAPIAIRELDATDSDWSTRIGEPRWWSTGTGRVRSVEVHEVQTDYIQGYALLEADHGIPRTFTGERTYAVAAVAPPPNAYAYTHAGDTHALGFIPQEIVITGLGLRITTAATDPADGYGTQVWEAEFLNGETTFTTGITRGAYTWEVEFGAEAITLGVGTIRQAVSPDRQYLAAYSDAQPTSMCGRVVDWHSSDSALMVTEVVLPDLDLTEQDTPALLPAPMQKYVRYFVLGRAFGRAGEGRQPVLADHYLRRFKRGVEFFRRLADVAHKDRVFVREAFAPAAPRRPRVRLPSTYPSVW